MNSTLEGFNSRITEEEQISDLDNRTVGNTTAEQNIERNEKSEDSLRDFWENIKHTNIHITGVPEGEEKEKGPKKIFEEIIAETSLTWERKQSTKFRKCRESPADEPKEEHTKTYSNQNDEN